MKTDSKIRLNLGSGWRFHSDWHNLDFAPQVEGVIIHDLREPLPYEDGTVDACYSAHVLGHLQDAEAHQFLREQYRVLKPGGVARFSVPDLQQVVNEYLTLIGPLCEGDDSRAADYQWNRIEMHDQMARSDYGGRMAEYLAQRPVPNPDYVLSRIGEEGRGLMDMKVDEIPVFKSPPKASHLGYYLQKAHRKAIGGLVRLLGGRNLAEAYRLGCFRKYSGEIQWRIYDFYSIAVELKAAGFEAVVKCSATESAIEKFSHFSFDTNPEGVERKPESLYVEAIKK